MKIHRSQFFQTLSDSQAASWSFWWLQTSEISWFRRCDVVERAPKALRSVVLGAINVMTT